jgi:glycosyltransferase A (GT-A) superfamily protein (DUF2064 family)
VCALAAGLADRAILAVAGDPEDATICRIAAAHGFARAAQCDGDLGARMAAALGEAQARGPACLIGSDAPTLPRARLADALERAARHDVVLGPSTDGGYWLVGGRTPAPELFRDMPWSTPAVLPETLRRLAGRDVALLPFHYDVDEPHDLTLLCAHLLVLPPAVAPATRRALAALGLL